MAHEYDQMTRRPWPLPDEPWTMAQRWHDLLFMHWPVDAEQMRLLVPDVLPLDLYNGQAWIGVVPFHMSGVRARFTPGLPWVSAFPELNVRTYVTLDGKPGVWFFSLDAGNPLAVWAARRFFSLPYFTARMDHWQVGDWVEYESARTHRGSAPTELRLRYRPSGLLLDLAPDSLDRWLTERYCLYAVAPNSHVIRVEIDHVPWPLQPAEAEVERNTMTAPLGVRLDGAPLLHFARFQDVHVWLPEIAR